MPFYSISSLQRGIDIHLGPPLPLDSSLELISITLTLCFLKASFVMKFLLYVITVFGAIAKTFDPSFHCSLSENNGSPFPVSINIISSWKTSFITSFTSL